MSDAAKSSGTSSRAPWWRLAFAWCGLGGLLIAALWWRHEGDRGGSAILLWTAIWIASGAVTAVGFWLGRRKALQQAQQQAAEAARWRSIFAATRQRVWEYDVRADTVRHSPLWDALIGYAGHEIDASYEAWTGRIHPDDTARVSTAMEQHTAGKTRHYESLHRIRDEDGGYRWVLDRGMVVERDAQGRPLRILGTKVDASERQLSQELLDRLAENVPGMLYQYQLEPDGSGHFPYVSKGAIALYGLTPEQLQRDASLVYSLIHPDDLPARLEETRAALTTLAAWHAEYRIIVPGRGERWVSGDARPQRLESGAILCHGYAQDITSEKQQALKLQETERLLRRLMNEMPMGLCLVDGHGSLYLCNRRFQQYFGCSQDSGLTLERWWQEEFPEPGYRQNVIDTWNADLAQARARAGEIPRRDWRVTLRDGSERTMAIGGLVVGDHIMLTFEDRTEQLAHSELLRKMAYVDGLTGIANRRRFDETLQLEWRRCEHDKQPLSLLMIDIDHFKAYNDLYGHQKGDECLQAVAKVLRDGLGRSHDLTARYGGEEFVCLLPECNLEGARSVAQRQARAVQMLGLEHRASAVADLVTVSIGVASLVPEPDNPAAMLLARADAHLYRAKQAGRNRVDDGGTLAA